MNVQLRVLGVLAALSLTGCKTYSEMMQSDLKDMLGSDTKKYRFFSYPTNNFGVGTMYEVGEDGKLHDEGQLCATTTCLGITAATTAGAPTEDSLKLDGYADVGSGGAVTLSQKDVTKVSVNLVMPKIYNMLQVGAGVDTSRGVTTKIVVDQAFKRSLNKLKTETFLKTLDNTDRRKVAFLAGKLGVVVGDVVIRSMTVDICVDSAINAGLKASLDSNLGKILGEGAQLQVGVNHSANGCYNLSVTKPVVSAVLSVRQRGNGVLEATAPNADWMADHLATDFVSDENGRNTWSAPVHQ